MFSASLGMDCSVCHIEKNGGQRAGEFGGNEPKNRARPADERGWALNRSSFGGRQMVTCNTCHRGTNRPNVMPSLAQLYGTPPPEEPGDPFEQAAGQPTPDQVLERYIQAIGGAQRLAGLTTLVAK